MKTKKNIRKGKITRRKKRGGDNHKNIKELLHNVRGNLFETKSDHYKEIIKNHNESTEKSNTRDLKKHDQLFPENSSPEDIKTKIGTIKKCNKLINNTNDKISKDFFKIYSNYGKGHRDLFIKKHIKKDFVKDLKELYLKPENRNIISNPNQGFLSRNKDYSDDKVYLDHIKHNYVNAFELPSSVENDMLYTKESDIYIIPRVTLVNIGTIRQYKDGNLIIQKYKDKTIVSKEEFNDLYVPLEYKKKREKFITKTDFCTKQLDTPIKDYKIHIKTTDNLDNVKKLLDENNITKEEVRISDELEHGEMDGGK